MMNKINFITGENYTLSKLFSDEGKIIIPDLQRDYCWGDEVHTKNKIELVSDFTTNLIQSFEQEQRNKLNLGLIYGYESLESHIQLCDGQQRITTLYLLIGMLNKKVEGKVCREHQKRTMVFQRLQGRCKYPKYVEGIEKDGNHTWGQDSRMVL